MSNFIQQTLARFGLTPESFAQEAERRGIGNAAQISTALANGDVSFLQAYGKKVQDSNPNAVQQAQAYMQGR